MAERGEEGKERGGEGGGCVSEFFSGGVGGRGVAYLLLGVEDSGVREGLVPDLVEGIGGVGDELAEEDLLVGVKGVDNQRQELVDVSAEREGFCFGLTGKNSKNVLTKKRGVRRL